MGQCESCTAQYKLNYCATVYHEDLSTLLYAHITINKSEILSYPMPNIRFGGMSNHYFQVGYNYHFRLEFDKNQTILAACNDDYRDEIAILPGYPVTPSNAHQKLETILTFS
jgi:hypothetical protein